MPEVGYTVVEMTNMSGPFNTDSDTTNSNIDAFWIKYI